MTTRQKTLMEVITGVSLVGFGAGVWVVADDFFTPVQADPLGPAFWPKTLACAIALLSAVDAGRALLQRLQTKAARESPQAAEASLAEEPVSVWRLGGVLALIVLYVGVLEVLGYFLATPLFVLGVLRTLGLRSWKDLLLPTIALPLIWGGLFVALGVPLPQGLLAF